MVVAYRGEGHAIQPGCTLQAHYAQVQALCDALGFAAQQQQAGYLEKGIIVASHAEAGTWASLGFKRWQEAVEAAVLAERMAHYWYGIFQGYRGLLRALEGNTGELEPAEQAMLERIDWAAAIPHFVVPGFEHVKLEEQVLPGA